MKSVFEMFGADKQLEQAGIDLDYGAFQVSIARAGGSNQRFNKALERYSKPYRHAIQRDLLEETVAKEILAKAYAESIILGWKGVTNQDGQPLEYTFDNCVWLLLTLPDLFQSIQEEATKLSNFRKQEEEDDLGN